MCPFEDIDEFGRALLDEMSKVGVFPSYHYIPHTLYVINPLICFTHQRELATSMYAIGSMCSAPLSASACSSAASALGLPFSGDVGSDSFPAGCFKTETDVYFNSIYSSYISASSTKQAICVDWSTSPYTLTYISSGTCASFTGNDARTLDYLGDYIACAEYTESFSSMIGYTSSSDPSGCFKSGGVVYFNSYLVGGYFDLSGTTYYDGNSMSICSADNAFAVATSGTCTSKISSATKCELAAQNMGLYYTGSESDARGQMPAMR